MKGDDRSIPMGPDAIAALREKAEFGAGAYETVCRRLNNWLVRRSNQDQLFSTRGLPQVVVDKIVAEYGRSGWRVVASADRDGPYLRVTEWGND